MRRLTAFILVGLFTAAALAQREPLALVPVASDRAVTLDDVKPSAFVPWVAHADGTMLATTAPGQTIADVELIPFDGPNGRGVALMHPWSTIQNVRILSIGDDGISIRNDAHGSLVNGVTIEPAAFAKPSKGFVCGADFGTPQPAYPLSVGGAGTIRNTSVKATIPFRMSGGVWTLQNCDIWIGPWCGIDAIDAKLNLIDVRFHTWPGLLPGRGMPYGPLGPCPIRVQSLKNGVQSGKNLKSAIFTQGCSIDGKPVATADLLRRFNPVGGYDGLGTVPASVVRKTMN